MAYRARRLPVALLAAPGIVLLPACNTAKQIKEVAGAAKDIQKDTEELDAKLKKAQSLTFTAEYEVKDGDATAKRYRLVQSPPKGAYITDDSVFLDDGTALVSCTKSSGSFTCTNVGPHTEGGFFAGGFGTYVGNPLAFLPGLRLAAALGGFTVNKSSETIGGIASDCVAYDKSGTDGGHYKVCTSSADGLLTKSEDKSSATTLVSFNKSVDPADLQPPAKATSIEDQIRDATSTTSTTSGGGSTTSSIPEDATTTSSEPEGAGTGDTNP